VAKAFFGKVELDIGVYKKFLLSTDYLYPTSSNGVYSASRLVEFFANAQTKLKSLLSKVPLDDKPIDVSLNEEFLHKYTLVGHGKTGLSRDGLITGWSSDMLCEGWVEKINYIDFGLDLVKRNEIPGGLEQAAEHADKINLADYHLRFVSDLPRAIHHALLLKKDKDLKKDLEIISSKISNEMKVKGNIFDTQLYRDLTSLATDNGFIPTPFLRAQYYGPLELKLEKLEKPDKENWVNGVVAKAKEQGLDTQKANEEANKIADALIARKNLLYFITDDDGNVLTENRMDLVKRIASFYNTVNEVSKGKEVLVVTSSGCFDASSAYFRNFGKPGIIPIANEPKVRGNYREVKLGTFNGDNCYLNDPKKIDDIKKSSADVALRQREASLDEGIRNKEDFIIPVELLRFDKKENGKYESHKISLDDVIKSAEPTLILGNFGQGKSTAAVELTEKLNSDDKYKKEYVAVLLTARDINDSLHNRLRNCTDSEKYLKILNLLSQGVPSLPKFHREDFKFVFVIDALDEVHNYREDVLHVARVKDQLKEYGQVIITSRFTGFNEYENEGFTTLQLDPQAVIRNIDQYLASRITGPPGKTDKNHFNIFKEFLMRQDDGVKTNYLLVHFLADLYNRKPDELGNLNGTLSEGEILIKGIQVALWDHKLTKRSDMPQQPQPYNGQPPNEKLEREWKDYDKTRLECLSTWMDFLQRTAAYMTVHNTSTIDREGLEEVKGGWTIEKYLSKSKVK